MGKLWISSALFVLPICAQYSDLVTTRDGNQLYFSSSLRLRGTTEVDSPKIFRYTAAFDLIQQPATPTEYLEEPEVSADGTVTGYTDSNPFECSHTVCATLTPPPESGVVAGIKIPHQPLDSLIGRLRLARDGKSAMICCGTVAPRTHPTLVDLRTGAVVHLKGFDAIGDGRQAFADLPYSSPVVLLVQKDIPVLYHGGKTTRLHFAHTPILARMSSDARTIVYEAADPGGRYELIVHHAGTGVEETLQKGPPVPAPNFKPTPSYFQPWISDDGLSVLFLAANTGSGVQQACIESTNGSGFRRLTNSSDVPEGVNTATLSGDGSVAFAGTPDGRILRILAASGRIEELAGRTPHLMALQTVAVGSVTWISGAALSEHNAHPRMMAGDLEAPVISAQPALVKFQIPWEVPAGQPVEIRLEYGSPPPFESVLTVTTATVNAAFLNPQVSPFEISMFPEGLAFHQDFRSLVLPSDPAQPGETIHFYMSGLGPVTHPVQTGQKTPRSGPLHKTIYPPLCGVPLTGRVTVDAKVRFSGLAPGYVGLYQLDLEVPNGLVNADSPLGCSFPDPEEGGYMVIETRLYVRLP